MQMPNMDGIELTKMLTADERFQSIKLFIMTPINYITQTEYISQLRVHGFFPKPATTSDLVSVFKVASSFNKTQNKSHEQTQIDQTSFNHQWPEQTRILLVEAST